MSRYAYQWVTVIAVLLSVVYDSPTVCEVLYAVLALNVDLRTDLQCSLLRKDSNGERVYTLAAEIPSMVIRYYYMRTFSAVFIAVIFMPKIKNKSFKIKKNST